MPAGCCYRSGTKRADAARVCLVTAGVLLASGLLLPARQALADDSKEATYGDPWGAFRWFGTLGYPDVAKAKLAMVTKGQRVPNGATAPHTNCELGFLLSEEGNRFTVLSLTLQTMQYTKAPEPPKGEHHQLAGDGAWFEPIDLVKVATATLSESRSADQLSEINQVARLFFRSHTPESLRLFILAWACSRQGHEELAQSLFDRAKQIPEHGPAQRGPKRQLIERVKEELATIEMWEAMIAFSDPTVSRQALLDHLIEIMKRFPESPYIDRARETANLLTMMIAEERDHAAIKPDDPAWDKLEAKEQIAELIFQLRDQNSYQILTDGPISIFFGSRDHQAPAELLAAFGPQAVPQLLDALSDPRPCRSVGAARTFCFSHHVVTVGECACEILERVASRSFYNRKSSSGYMSSDGQTQAVEAAARQWYADFLAKGEKQTLVDATVAGDRNSPPQATVLVKKYPDAALPALIAGARAAREQHVRAGLVHLIGGLPDEESQAFVLAELKASPFVSCRLLAAQILHRQGRPEAVPAMIAPGDEGGRFRFGSLGRPARSRLVFGGLRPLRGHSGASRKLLAAKCRHAIDHRQGVLLPTRGRARCRRCRQPRRQTAATGRARRRRPGTVCRHGRFTHDRPRRHRSAAGGNLADATGALRSADLRSGRLRAQLPRPRTVLLRSLCSVARSRPRPRGAQECLAERAG
jgi:hypothetical protein